MTYNSANYHALTIEEALSRLNAAPTGLTVAEAEKRLKECGKNKLPEPKRRTALEIFHKQLKNPLVYFLFAAVLIAASLGEVIDASIIGAAILISAIFGFVQEYKSEKAIEELNKVIKETARVIRDNEEKRIEAEFLVPGDIIILQDGYKIPADARILEERNLEINESMLTGESVSEFKSHEVLSSETSLADRRNMVYAGSLVVRGSGLAVVVGTGAATEVGKIATSLGKVRRAHTPLEFKIAKLSRNLSVAILIALVALFVLGLVSGIPGREMLLTSIALVAAAVPEGLVVSVTAVLVIGMRRLMRQNALVRNLSAVETVGQATVICADKTGTITQGTMEMAAILPRAQGFVEHDLLRIGILTSDSRVENPDSPFAEWRLVGDPTSRAVLHAALDSGLLEEYLKRQKMILDETPFESDAGYRSILINEQEQNTVYFLGIPEKLIEAGVGSEKDKKILQSENMKLSQSGFRMLGVARKRLGENPAKLQAISNLASGLNFLGFFALKDPLRESVKDSIRAAGEAGIRVMMLTGDNKYTAAAIAKELNLPAEEQHLLDSMDAATLDESALAAKVKELTVFARVTPVNKLKIVESLQKQGEVVAMTGDGVNDAPALRRANIGIALGSGQSVSREAADIVLLDDNFKTIVRAIEEGRGIFDNIKKVVAFLLYDSFIEVFLVAASILLGLPIPILPAQILWINLVEDTFPAFALALEPREKDVMLEKPAGFRGRIIDAELRSIIFGFGIVSALLLFGLFQFLLAQNLPLAQIRTIMFIGLTIDSLFVVFSLKSLRRSIWQIPLFNNKYLWAFVFGGLIFLTLPVYWSPLTTILRTVPLGLKSWLLLFSLGIINLILLELVKLIFIRARGRRKFKSA